MLELIPFEPRMGNNFIPYEVIEAAMESASQKVTLLARSHQQQPSAIDEHPISSKQEEK